MTSYQTQPSRTGVMLLLLAAFSLFFVGGCGSGNDSSQPPDAVNDAPPDTAPPEIPDFPWPPPSPSARWSLPLARINVSKPLVTLGDVDRLLSDTLMPAGYSSMSYFAVPGGFAVVTQIEAIKDDGCPEAPEKRWNPNAPPLHRFSVREIASAFRDLFRKDAGRSRVLVFVVNDTAFSTTGDAPTRATATAWLKSGLNVLPQTLATKPVGDGCVLTVLMYEFVRSVADGEVKVVEQCSTPLPVQFTCTRINITTQNP